MLADSSAGSRWLPRLINIASISRDGSPIFWMEIFDVLSSSLFNKVVIILSRLTYLSIQPGLPRAVFYWLIAKQMGKAAADRQLFGAPAHDHFHALGVEPLDRRHRLHIDHRAAVDLPEAFAVQARQ